VNLSAIVGQVIVFVHPGIQSAKRDLPEGWLTIEGLAGCTVQSCGFRDHHQEFRDLGSTVFGLSVQTLDDQLDARWRLHLPFHLLSDERLAFIYALSLPLIDVGTLRVAERLTLVLRDGVIERVDYPVTSLKRSAADVLRRLGQ